MSKIISTTITFGKYTDVAINQLKAAGHEVMFNTSGTYYTEPELIQLGKDNPETAGLIVGGDHINQQVIAAFPNLKVIAMHGVGVDKIDRTYAQSKSIIVTNTPGANSIDVAEYVIALLIIFNRKLDKTMPYMKAGIWDKKVGKRVSGQTLGIIGVGNIGIELAKRASLLGMTVLGVDPYPNECARELGVSYVTLEELLSESDAISLHSPMIKWEPPVINEASLKLVKPDALIINAARAPLVDLDAVEDALSQQRLGGFITDVYDVEPPEERKLWQLENVIMTPHGGGGTIEANMNMGEMAAENVIDVLSGGVGVTPVN